MESHSHSLQSLNSQLNASFKHTSRLKLKLKEYHDKYPRIRKSLIFSKSADFTEYETLLLEASPICAPDRIYLIRNPEPEDDNYYCGQFSITCNKSAHKAAYKIKSSSSRAHYAVSPHRGYIDPGEEIRVIVHVRPRNKHGDTGDDHEKSLFKNAVLAIFTAEVAPSADYMDITEFWDQFEANTPYLVGAHFIKKFFVVENNGDIDFGSNCTHNIFNVLPEPQTPPDSPKEQSPDPPSELAKARHRVAQSLTPLQKPSKSRHRHLSIAKTPSRRLSGSRVKGSKKSIGTDDDENLRYLHVYNCMLLEKLVAQSKLTEYTIIFLLVFLFLLILVILILLRGFGFI